MRRKTVGFLHHGLRYGGATNSLFLTLKSLSGRGFDRYVLSVPYCASEEVRRRIESQCSGLDWISIPEIHCNQYGRELPLVSLWKRVRPLGSLIDAILRRELDILHVNATVFPHVYRAVRRRTRAKIVTHVRELLPRYGSGADRDYVVRQIAEHSDAIIAISDNEAKPFEGHPGLHVVPNPFDFAEAQQAPGDLRGRLGVAESVVLVGMLGAFIRPKGQLEFVKALREVAQSKEVRFPFRFVMLGVPARTAPWRRAVKRLLGLADFREEVTDYVDRNGLGPHLAMLPYTSGVVPVLKALDVVVRPALTGDPWGRDIIEAMSVGKPVIATGQSQFYLRDGETGYLVPPASPAEMAARLIELINEPGKRAQLGRAGEARARAMCDLETYGKRLAEIYEGLG